MSDLNLSPAAHALLTLLQGVPTATQFDSAAAEELIARGYAALVPAGAMIEITEAGRLHGRGAGQSAGLSPGSQASDAADKLSATTQPERGGTSSVHGST